MSSLNLWIQTGAHWQLTVFWVNKDGGGLSSARLVFVLFCLDFQGKIAKKLPRISDLRKQMCLSLIPPDVRNGTFLNFLTSIALAVYSL